MASFAALRMAAASAGLLPRFTDQLRPVCYAPSIARSFNTSAQMKRYEEDDDDMRDVDVDRRRGDCLVPRGSGFFSDVFDPFTPTRSLRQVLNLMDRLSESPFLAASRGISIGVRRGWGAKEDTDALHLRIDMPGLGKEHVKVSVEENTLTIEGEGEKELEEDEDGAGRRRYSSRIDLPPNLYKLGEIKAEMKNGVLKVVVPKVKEEEERRDVFHVKIE